MNRTIRTFTGRDLDVFDPNPDDIDIIDIAHGLSHSPRFGGQLRYRYCNAEHSVYGSHLIESQLALEFLMHDSTEAYICDMPSPIKKMLPEYVAIEDRLMKVIALKFGFEYPFQLRVKEIDNEIFRMEWNIYMTGNKPPAVLLNHFEAERLFNHRYEQLKRK